jgi:hypothetical protein
MQDLTAFLCNMEQARIRLLSEVDVGPAGGMNTMILSKYRQRVRKEIQAVLDDEQGSIQKLRKTLDSLNRFLYGLNEAYQASTTGNPRSPAHPEPMASRAREAARNGLGVGVATLRSHPERPRQSDACRAVGQLLQDPVQEQARRVDRRAERMIAAQRRRRQRSSAPAATSTRGQ